MKKPFEINGPLFTNFVIRQIGLTGARSHVKKPEGVQAFGLFH